MTEAISESAVEYKIERDVSSVPLDWSLDKISGEYLTPARLANSQFAIIAHKGDAAVGMILAEKPWGHIGEQWNKHIPNALEIGALFVLPEYRNGTIGYRLAILAAREIVVAGKTPVAVTKTDSQVHAMLLRTGAEKRQDFVHNNEFYTPWVLSALV